MKQDGHDTYQEYTVTFFRICPAGLVERGHLILHPVGLSFCRRSLVTCRSFYCVNLARILFSEGCEVFRRMLQVLKVALHEASWLKVVS